MAQAIKERNKKRSQPLDGKVEFMLEEARFDDWMDAEDAKMRRVRDFFWPPGDEDSEEALRRRRALGAATGLHDCVGMLQALDGRHLFAAMHFLTQDHPFHQMVGMVVAMRQSRNLQNWVVDVARMNFQFYDLDDFAQYVEAAYAGGLDDMAEDGDGPSLEMYKTTGPLHYLPTL